MNTEFEQQLYIPCATSRAYQKELIMNIELEQQPYIKQMPKGECTYCDLQYDKPTGFFPPHTASSRCQSGGYNHCTCDTCF